MAERRVAVTGIGALCALGSDRETVWNGLVHGRCGIGPLSLFARDGYRSATVAEIPDYQPARTFTPLERRRLSRSDQIAILAAGEALEDGGVLETGVDRTRIGVLFGSGTADLLRNEEYLVDLRAHGVRHARVSKAVNHFSSTPMDLVGSRFGLEGIRGCLASACSSSTAAIGYASDLIREGLLDAAVCGGCDVLCRLTLSGFNALHLVDSNPCRPFDVARNGMNIGEAAGVLLLEGLDQAAQRGARVYAELAGYGLGCEAYHPTSPEPEGRAIADVINAALVASGVRPDEVDHVNTHGTGTIHNDVAEARGLKLVFGERVRTIPVNAIKSMVGHCLGAAGAIEAVALALTIAHGIVPPAIHHDETDPECELDVVANTARTVPVTCGLSTSLAFGGNDAALLMRAVGR